MWSVCVDENGLIKLNLFKTIIRDVSYRHFYCFKFNDAFSSYLLAENVKNYRRKIIDNKVVKLNSKRVIKEVVFGKL